jgi:hypothetical protein
MSPKCPKNIIRLILKVSPGKKKQIETLFLLVLVVVLVLVFDTLSRTRRSTRTITIILGTLIIRQNDPFFKFETLNLG